MTEAMPIDVSGKIISNAKPAAPEPPGPTGERSRPKSPAGEGATGDAPPAPGSKTFLGWVAGGFLPQAAHHCRRSDVQPGRGDRGGVADLAGERTTRPRATHRSFPTHNADGARSSPPRTGPTLTLEPPGPPISFRPRVFPCRRLRPMPAASQRFRPPSGSRYAAGDPVARFITGLARPQAGQCPPFHRPRRRHRPRPSRSSPRYCPRVGPTTSCQRSLRAPAASCPPSRPRGDRCRPRSPSGPASTPPAPMNLDPRAAAPVVGMPPTPPTSLVPPVGDGPKLPAAPAELSPMLPAIPGPSGAKPTDSKLEFVKPAESSTATPAAATRAPTTSYDVDIYHPQGQRHLGVDQPRVLQRPEVRRRAPGLQPEPRARAGSGCRCSAASRPAPNGAARRPLRGLPRPAPLPPLGLTTGTRPESARSAPGPIASHPATA